MLIGVGILIVLAGTVASAPVLPGGRPLPKQAAQCDAMLDVVTGSPGVRIITHDPELTGEISSWAQLA